MRASVFHSCLFFGYAFLTPSWCSGYKKHPFLQVPLTIQRHNHTHIHNHIIHAHIRSHTPVFSTMRMASRSECGVSAGNNTNGNTVTSYTFITKWHVLAARSQHWPTQCYNQSQKSTTLSKLRLWITHYANRYLFFDKAASTVYNHKLALSFFSISKFSVSALRRKSSSGESLRGSTTKNKTFFKINLSLQNTRFPQETTRMGIQWLDTLLSQSGMFLLPEASTGQRSVSTNRKSQQLYLTEVVDNSLCKQLSVFRQRG